MKKPGEPAVVVLDDAAAVASEGATRVAEALRDAVARRARADFALTGGTTVGTLYERLAIAPWREGVPWSQVHLWWSDERMVPGDHPASNYALVRETLLAVDAEAARGAPVAVPNIHAFPVDAAIGEGRDASWVAATYANELRHHLPAGERGWPAFDVVLLSVGTDGHIMSVFPGSPALDAGAPPALAIPAPAHIAPHLPRVTLRPDILDVAGTILVIVVGAAKSGILATVLGSVRDPRRWPAQLARRRAAVWLVDRAAASDLR